MTTIRELVAFLENLAPAAYQENYDNSGLLTGSPSDPVKGVLVSLDCTEDVIEEAMTRGCNVVVAHHPVIFKGLKSLTGKNYVERTIIKAIRNDIAIYGIHTNLDNIAGGVNFRIAEKLHLQNIRILAPKKQLLMKLTVFVPVEDTGTLLDALYAAGAGEIGNYSQCSFRVSGKGTFKPNEKAQPHIGYRGQAEEVDENRVEVIFPAHLEKQVLAGMRKGHKYEEIAYYLTFLENENQEVGSGAIGELENPMPPADFLAHLKENMKLKVIRHTGFPLKNITRVAVCGGSGSFLLGKALALGADVFVSADYKYHEFFDAENKIAIADIGHYESEQYTKELLVEKISKKFSTFATCLSETETNPVRYYF